MSDAATDEIDALVSEAAGDPPPAAPPEEAEAAAPVKKKRRVAKTKTNGNGAKSQTMEELEAEELLEGRVLPKPEKNVKTIGDMYAKYRIGDDPDFKVQVWRTWPKMFPGGKKADGFYDSWETALSLEQLQAEYGGGTYRIAIVGPHPTQPRRTKHYDSLSIQLAGDPKYGRVPRALQGQEQAKADAVAPVGPVPPMMMPAAESPKLAEAALKMIDGVAEREREDRHRAEDRARERVATQRSMMDPIIEAERRRADDVLEANRRASRQREEMMNERAREDRERQAEERRRMELAAHTAGQSRTNFADDLRAMAETGLLKNSDGGGIAKEMLTQVLEKHRGEVEAVQRQHTTFMESIRTGHANELSAIRDAHRRELEAEREASRSRESRIEERLTAEREERRRDQERARTTLEERDRQWKDRMEQQEATLKSSWESRHNSLISTYENRLQWAQGELDRLKMDNSEYRQKREEQGDPIAQISRMAELRTVMKDALGIEATATAAASGSGGIGLSGGDGDWKSTALEGVLERLPELAAAAAAGFQKPQQQQQQFQVGQAVPTPQGEMVVVPAPGAPGGMALAPRAAVEQAQRAGGAPPLLGGPQQHGPRVMPRPGQMPQRPTPKISAVPNLAEGLPRRRPAWEGGGVIDAPAPPPVAQPAPPQHPPRMTSRPETADPAEPEKLSNAERQGIRVVAKLVHDSVMEADEPEEFVAKVMSQYEPAILQQIVGTYTTDQIAQGIAQLEPNSAGATPGGQQFVRVAFRQLRAALRG